MRKLSLLAFAAVILSSCAIGTYMPSAYNNFGAQTQVVLDKANFQIVKDVEVVIEVNNSSLKRQDVEKSAYGELVRQYKLSGSQAFINVVIEEVRRDNMGFFRALFVGIPERKQYVAARATIIEFLPEGVAPQHRYTGALSTPDEPVVSTSASVAPVLAPETVAPVAEEPAKIAEPVVEDPYTSDEYYLAYLIKSGNFDNSYRDALKKEFDRSKIETLTVSYSVNELKVKGQGHSKAVNKYYK